MLRAEHLTVRVRAGDRALLDDLTLTFAPGELTAVVGPNGAGKTTLLRCLDGELAPSSGRVELAGRALGDWPRMELARARAVLPQQSTLDFPFSALDVALLGRIPHFGGGGGGGGAGNAADRAIAMRALQMCDCAGLEERAYPSLSGGEKQRVQTARALAQLFNAGDGGGDVGGDGDAGDGDGDAGDGDDAGGDGAGDGRGGGDGGDGDGGDSIHGVSNAAADTRFLLLDEPVSALDLRHQYQLLGLLKSLSRDGLGVVCTLHNLNLVAQFADRAIIIDRGMLVADGAPLEVFTEETIGHVFDLEVRIRPHPDDPQVPLLIPRLPSAAANAG
ncbi:MAG: heme ABC transporter ATP-binding protein [Gammaproteobacteria bacterium]|nr:heme ABC transporter ATP-binding protein [Gammaproteobacteria bacterium]